MNVIWQQWKPTPWSSSWDAPYCSWMACWNSGSVQWKRTSALSLAISKHFIWARHALSLSLSVSARRLTPHSWSWNGSIRSICSKQAETHTGGISFFLLESVLIRQTWLRNDHFALHTGCGVKFRGVNCVNLVSCSQISPDCLSKQSLLRGYTIIASL